MAVGKVVRSAGYSVGTRVVGPVVGLVVGLDYGQVVRPVGKALMVENWVEVAISTVEKSLAEKSQAVDY